MKDNVLFDGLIKPGKVMNWLFRDNENIVLKRILKVLLTMKNTTSINGKSYWGMNGNYEEET